MDLEEPAMRLFYKLKEMSQPLLQAIALVLGQRDDFLTGMTEKGANLLRALHYFLNPQEGLWATEHTDIDLLTILPFASEEGLEVEINGEWIPVIVPKNALIVNVGDMLEAYSNGRFPSCNHRVRCTKPNTERESIVFFIHPTDTTVIGPLGEEPHKFPFGTRLEYLFLRLFSLGLLSREMDEQVVKGSFIGRIKKMVEENQAAEAAQGPAFGRLPIPTPIRGVHNSQWLVCPGDDVRDHYEQHRQGLKAYVQDIVRAHKSDPRVVFWEIYNEPNKTEATLRLEKDAAIWIKETGTDIPVTATGKEFSGGPFSDFPSWHEYGAYTIFGDAHTLALECMNRKGQTVPGVVEHFKGKVGYIMWEFGIGRDNCRFAWDENREKPRPDETPTPFHGIVYPDGHPWSLADARALLGLDGYAHTHFFMVSYFKDPDFTQLAKTSVTPLVDFDLVDEAGVGSPDASAGVPRSNFSVEYRAFIQTPAGGPYVFAADCDGRVQIQIDGKTVLKKATLGRSVATGEIALEGYRSYTIVIRYTHATGPASLHLTWSGPTFKDRLLEPATHPEGI